MGDKPRTDHNVYILGAGFSADAGMPLVGNFLERMADAAEWFYANGRTLEAEAVLSVFELRLKAAGAAYRAELNVDNIEELFSLASASGGEAGASKVTAAIAATLDFAEQTTKKPTCQVEIKEVVDQTGGWNRKPINYPLYKLYAGIISGLICQPAPKTQNTVITLNYDTVLEDALADLEVPFHYGLPTDLTEYHRSAKSRQPDSREAIPIYKLHGSVNWSKPVNRGGHATVFGNYQDLYEERQEVLLIPPTWRKVFADHLVRVWEGAVEALNSATRIIVIGFSMPRTDTHFKYLIAAGLQQNISLRKFLFVNPGLDESREIERDELTRNLFSILRRELEQRRVIELVPEKANTFFLHREFRSKLNRELREEFLSIEYLMPEYATSYKSEQ